ncbi:MAG: polymerase sigma-70 factor, subfamily [Clostridia bacterium]|nr:polymerase sigma-70 factor, subfamily [Clostridia bacterium]
MNLGLNIFKRNKANEVTSFENLVLKYQDRVYGLSYQLTGNHADAQDLTQEVFIKAYKGLSKFRHEADIGTWLHRITVNLYLNEKRKVIRHPVVSLDNPINTGDGEITREVAATDGDPQDIIEAIELKDFIKTALRELPEEYQSVLVLRELQGYSYDEIAKILDCSLGTVKSRLNRARQAMRDKVSKMNKDTRSK